MIPNWDEQKESPGKAMLSRVDYCCSHKKQKELLPAVPEAIAFTADGITMNNIVHASPVLGCGSPRLWRE